MNIYVASQFQNHRNAKALMGNLQHAGHTITHDWTSNARAVEAGDLDPSTLTPGDWRDIGEAEFQGVVTADVLVVLHPGLLSTHTEFGIALGAGVPVVLVGEPEQMIPFYALGRVERVAGTVELLGFLGDDPSWRPKRVTDRAGMADVFRECYAIAESKGWHENDDPGNPQQILAWLMLAVTELAEAAEDVREGRLTEWALPNGKPCGFPSELADVVIRVADTAEAMGIDLAGAILRKCAFNRTRSFKHGNKAL